MEKEIRITAVCGWAIPESWFWQLIKDYFPKSEVQTIYPLDPASSSEARSLLAGKPTDLYIGYSLGTLWLLHHKKYLMSKAILALLAPIPAFLLEENKGGKTSRAQLKILTKFLKETKNAEQTLWKFFNQCEISPTETFWENMPSREALLKGLDFLNTVTFTGEWEDNSVSIIGLEDPFINSDIIKQFIPRLNIIPGAGHAPQNLLERLKVILDNRTPF